MKKENIILFLDKAIELSLYALIFTLPFSKSMVEICFTAALICWIIKRLIAHRSLAIRAFKPEAAKINLPVGAFVIAGFFSAINSVSLPLSLEGLFFKLFQWVMIFFLVAETVASEERLKRVLIVIFSSVVLIGIDAIFQFITGADFIRHYAVGTRLQASFRSPNSFAGWLVVMLPLSLSFAYFGVKMHVSRAIKSISWIVTGVLMFCLALTYTRGAWIAAVLSLIFIGVCRSRKLLVFTLAALLLFPFIAPRRITQRIASTFENSKFNKIRPFLWREALNIIKDFPLVGCGLNTYAVVAPGYKITEEGGIYPHNSYLHMAAESGLLGLAAFAWTMLALFRSSLADLKRMRDGFHSAVLVGLLAGLFGFLVHSFVDTNIYALQLGNLMWFIMGLIIAAQKVSLRKGAPTR